LTLLNYLIFYMILQELKSQKQNRSAKE
jgi:hypothetical protein